VVTKHQHGANPLSQL